MRMRSFHWCLLIGSLLLVAAACSPRGPQAEYRTTATIKDIMDSMVDPNADYLWESVATIVTAAGTEERAPRTNEDWIALRRHAIPLVEATNLLQMPGRHVAKPGEKSENPGIELGPEEMAKDYPALLDAGCNIVGGCCGSNPEHIRLIADVVRSRRAR